MKKLFLMLLIGLILISAISCGGGKKSSSKGRNDQNNGSYVIRAEHPRIFLTPEQLSILRNIKNSDDDYSILKKYIDDRINYGFDIITNNFLSTKHVEQLIINTCIVALAESDAKYINKVKQWIEYVKNMQISSNSDEEQRNRLVALAIAYDWLYDQYSETERKALADKIFAYLQFLDQEHRFFNYPKYTNGHSRRGNEVGLIATLALWGEDDRIKPYYNKIYYNWLGNPSGYQYVLDTAGRDGGHYFGWSYGASYTSTGFSMAWYSATSTATRSGQLWGENYYNDAPYFYAYGTDPYQYPYKLINGKNNSAPGVLPSIGDCYNLKPSLGSDLIAFATGKLNNGIAEWYYQNYLADFLWEASRWPRIIAKTINRTFPMSPSSLPLARKFSGSGFVIARNTWNDASNPSNPSEYPTIMVFKSTPFVVANHDHADQNTLTINFKGPLLIDSGTYGSDKTNENDKYNSNYWKEYYTQTKAHNGLLIDGTGQRRDLSDSLFQPDRMMDGIKKFSQASSPHGIWTQGEATGAYSSSLGVTQYKRDVLMAYKPVEFNHAAFLVVDRVKMKANHTPKILWQVREEPSTVDEVNKYALIQNGFGGYARLEMFSSNNIILESVSSEYSQNDTEGNGVAGWGRLEASTISPVNDARFVTLIIIDQQSIPTDRIAKAKYLSGTGWSGVAINKTILIIADHTKDLSDITLSSQDVTGIKEIYVAGMKDGLCKIKTSSTERTVSIIDGFGYISW